MRAAQRPDSIIEQSSLFDFYDGGGIDIAFLGFAEIDGYGHVNVSKFGGKRPGAGGFINITACAKTIVFCGTMTAKGLDVAVENGRLRINREGELNKLVPKVRQVTFDSRLSQTQRIKGNH